MSQRYAVLSEVLSDNSVVYNVCDMRNGGEPILDVYCEDIYAAIAICDEENMMDEDPEIGDGMTDAEADADVLSSAGWGTDEDYGYADEVF